VVDKKDNEFSRLFIHQKGMCPICNRGLGNLTNFNLKIHNMWPFFENLEAHGNFIA
jgi:hypothetical protein